jgi:predicted RNA-binding Zn-ribbon protein involved in translation (DUF1610 family)
MPFLKSSLDGELLIDHRASPGIPEQAARLMDLPPQMVREGSVMTAATLACPHCGSVVVLNPLRTRARAHCYQCNQYVCDICDAVRHEPDYVHRTMREICDLVASGRYTMSGPMSRPVLTRAEGS